MGIVKAEVSITYDEIFIIEVHISDEGVHNALVRYIGRKVEPERIHKPTRYYEVSKFYFEKVTEDISDAPDAIRPVIQVIRDDDMFHTASIIAMEHDKR